MATASEFTMYGLMFVLPLVGWGMLSAARYPIVLFGSVHLPFILPHDAMLYALLRTAHTLLAYLFFLTFIAHFGAILFHTLIVRDGILITPPGSDNILEGITRLHLMTMAGDLGIPVTERSIDRTELYMADEVFLCGTGAQLAPVVEVDRRPIGSGKVGPITRRLHQLYFDAVRGRSDAYRDWLTPVY